MYELDDISKLLSEDAVYELLYYSFDYQKIQILNNNFINNYALISNCLWISGATRIIITGNTFTNNSIPHYTFFSLSTWK